MSRSRVAGRMASEVFKPLSFLRPYRQAPRHEHLLKSIPKPFDKPILSQCRRMATASMPASPPSQTQTEPISTTPITPTKTTATTTTTIPATSETHPSITTYLPNLLLQPPYYITIHIHKNQYLVTLGDTITLPALLYHPKPTTADAFDNEPHKLAKPGEVLTLTHASTLGSREYTIKGAPYIDGRMFSCKARVVEITAEPMRYKKKTKRRNRMVKTVKSKHRYTVLRICELEVKKGGTPEAFAAAAAGAVPTATAASGEAVKMEG